MSDAWSLAHIGERCSCYGVLNMSNPSHTHTSKFLGVSCFLSSPFRQPSDYSLHDTSSAVFSFFFISSSALSKQLYFSLFPCVSLCPSPSLSTRLYICTCSQVCATDSFVRAPVHDMRRRIHEAMMGCVDPAPLFPSFLISLC